MSNAKTSASSKFNLWTKTWPVAEKPLSVNIGTLSLVIFRTNYEWKVNYKWQKKDASTAFDCDYVDASPDETVSLDRIVMESMTHELFLTPRLADRTVVVRPNSPLIIPGQNRVTLHVSTPMWVCINFSSKVSREFPSIKLSDTWVGRPSGAGELCYGAFTHAQLDKKLLFKLPFRALTPVTVHNTGTDSLKMERLSIPAPYLSIFKGEEQLETEPITISMDPATLRSGVIIGKVAKTNIISAPRLKSDASILANTWHHLFD